MNTSSIILKKANKIIQLANTRDMIKVAQYLGIKLYFEEDYQNLLGLYTCAYKTRAIFINNRLNKQLTQLVIAHEIGHDMLHRELAKKGALKEFALFSIRKDSIEYEANAFAAHLLLDTEQFIAFAKEGRTTLEIANLMHTEEELVLIKLKELVAIGYTLQLSNYAQGNFLKKYSV